MVKWRELRLSTNMLKIHGIEDHLVNQMRKFNGIGCFIEDFIEQAHQFGMKDEKRTANMRDRKKAAYSHSSFEVASQNIYVIAQKELVLTRSRRNLKRRKGEENKRAVKKVKDEKRTFILENVNMTPHPIDDYKAKLSNVDA